MLRFLALALGGFLLAHSPVAAQTAANGPRIVEPGQVPNVPPPTSRHRIGYGRLTTNDLIGDGQDRWRTGSLTGSRVWAWNDWSGRAPGTFGDLLELRSQGEIMTPEDLVNVNPADRPWAGKLSLGLHTHWTSGAMEYALGGDMVIVGPQTQLDHVQRVLHDIFNAPQTSDAVLGQQIGNQFLPTVVGEIGRTYELGTKSRVRPFAEFRAGDESMVRFGADLTLGHFGAGELLVRESVTGHRYRVVRDPVPGVSFVLGADVAKVFDSAYLPSSRGYQLTDTRNRVRAGLHWQGEDKSVFYGLTWLDKEFVGQRDNQVTGSVRFQFLF